MVNASAIVHLATFTGNLLHPFLISPGFDIQKVSTLAESLPSHSWEFGAAAQALLELRNASLSVFGPTPFPVRTVSQQQIPALAYAADKIELGGGGANVLADGDGAVGDPASLGVSAVMLGKTDDRYAQAASETINYLMNSAPRFWNGAISQRVDTPELWADFMYMAPPFIAYYAADQGNETLLRESVAQCSEYRQVLQSNASDWGLWEHISGPQTQDRGLWSTGNGWAAAGMARVLATVVKAPATDEDTSWRQEGIDSLTAWTMEILDGALASSLDHGLVRNYMDQADDSEGHGFGEISGSALLASVVYRMAVLQPQSCGSRYIAWADGVRGVLGGMHVTDEGVATPAVNPLGWQDPRPYTEGSPEGQAFVVMMYSAWRDCVLQGLCRKEQAVRRHRSREQRWRRRLPY